MLRAREAKFLSEVKPSNQSSMEQIYTGVDVAKDSFIVPTKQEGKVTCSTKSIIRIKAVKNPSKG